MTSGAGRLLAVAAAVAALAACEGRPRVRPAGEFFEEGPARGGPQAPASPVRRETAPPPAEGLDHRARAAYESAKGHYSRGDLAAMQQALEQAVKHQPDFTEGWYNLGACQSNRALETIREGDEEGALAFFRAAVESKKRARELMEQGVWYVYLTGQEQEQVRADVEAALEDADAVLEDEASLLAALRLMAGE